MTLETGTRLGVYEILSPLGAGGMGEVYRARDMKLQRDVALKVLPDTMARDAQRMARFEREAQVLASLNHPNIAAIHGLEESNGIRALVMELVEGETLKERIGRTDALPGEGFALPRQRGALPYQDALPIARQIAEALEYAHERGVVHRDLKPANVKITPEGTVKVLDFGLAKVLDTQDSSATMDITNSPTLSAMATQAGVILGTAAYMSPEQAKGQRVDRRADIWAFGCVLYEMLTGQKPFEGETISDLLAAVIRAEPEWTAIPDATPPSIQRLVRRCLQKDQRQRLQAIGDARITIEETLSGGTGVPPVAGNGHDAHATEGARRTPLRVLPWVLAGVFAALALGIAIRSVLHTSAPGKSPVLAYIPPPPHTTFRSSGFRAGPVVVSPDGKQLAFTATDKKGITRLYVRSLDSNEAKAIPGTENATAPFWSPESDSLGFFANQKLKTVSLGNGNVRVLANGSCGTRESSGAWSPGGTILFTPSCTAPLEKISASGGEPSPATKLESGERFHDSPTFLPNGRYFLYDSGRAPNSSVWIGSLGSDERKLVLKGASSPEFASGHLLFIRSGRVFAQPFNPAPGKLTGEATVLAEAQAYSVSSRGVLAYQGGTPVGRLEWFDRSGNPLGSVGPVARYRAVRISPHGKRVLADVEEEPHPGTVDLWSYPAGGGPGTRLTFSPGAKMFSVWSPDGKYIAYGCESKSTWGICRKPADGSGAAENLVTLNAGIYWAGAVGWSPEGRYLSFDSFDAKGNKLWILPLFGKRKPFQPAAINTSQYEGEFSPDGRWLAYFSSETGRSEVYVVPVSGRGGKFQISQNGGVHCRWDKRGHLYFLTLGNRLVEADLSMSGGSVHVKAIHPLFQLSLPSIPDHPFDVSADGSRFLVVTSTNPNASRSIGLLLNWQSKLKGNE